MAGKLQGKVCVITGSSGMAASTAELARREGALLFLCSNSQETCSELAARLGGKDACEFLVADLTLSRSAVELVQRCVSRYGRIDALFNAAGISGRQFGDGPVHECTEEGWEMTLGTNARSVFFVSKETVGQMLRQPLERNESRGVILNMASVLAFSPEPRFFATHAYAASKGAIISLSKAMAAYYAPQGIRVNVLAPGLVRTPMSRRAQENPEILEFLKTKQPLTRNLIQPEDVARSAVFLLSEESSGITGAVVPVDAGWSVSG